MNQPPTVRTYQARTQAQAAQLAAADPMAAGRHRVSELWTAPQTWRVFLTPVILIVLGLVLFGIYGAAIGALIGIAYILLVRPKGTLTITYQ